MPPSENVKLHRASYVAIYALLFSQVFPRFINWDSCYNFCMYQELKMNIRWYICCNIKKMYNISINLFLFLFLRDLSQVKISTYTYVPCCSSIVKNLFSCHTQELDHVDVLGHSRMVQLMINSVQFFQKTKDLLQSCCNHEKDQ